MPYVKHSPSLDAQLMERVLSSSTAPATYQITRVQMFVAVNDDSIVFYRIIKHSVKTCTREWFTPPGLDVVKRSHDASYMFKRRLSG